MENNRECSLCIWYGICHEDEVCDEYYPAYETDCDYDDDHQTQCLEEYRNDWFKYIYDFDPPEDGMFI